ncbi:hypothetical protein QAD02_010511 [Eretmocerus hayati]|uniref:Uncharacterized protein n=1 Tax=Eretmocerus hayati TaxID=131215 RepID=A0ACC2NU16_9HYME|nr:hypothetical protein QAD02_010511 [Eretmocerus hayati]
MVIHFRERALTTHSLVNLLDDGVEVDAKDEYGDTMLLRAIKAKQFDLVIILLARGASPSLGSKAETRGQPLREAVRMNCSEVDRVLLQHGASLDDVDDFSKCIVQSLEISDTQMVETLLEHGPNPDTPLNSRDRCVLNHGISCHKDGLVNLCLDPNANVNIPDYLVHTAIFLAIQNDDIILVQKLIARGANLQVWDDAGFYLLTWAIIHNNEEIIMLTSGIDITK